MDIVAIGPDGSRHIFPDGTPDEVIDRVMRERFSSGIAPGVPGYSSDEPILRAPTTGERAGNVARDFRRSVESGLVQAPVSLAQLPASLVNLVGRVNPFFYEDNRYSAPGSGGYNAPLITREEAMRGMENLTGDERYTYQPTTRTGQLTQATAGGAAEGGLGAMLVRSPGLVARGIRSGQIALSNVERPAVGARGVRPLNATDIGYLARDVGGEALAGGGGAFAGTATALATDNPVLGAAVGGITGVTAGRATNVPSAAESRARRTLSNYGEADFARAQQIIDGANELGITITPLEALMAAKHGGGGLAELYTSAVRLSGRGDVQSDIAAARIQRGGEFEQALNQVLAEIRSGETDPQLRADTLAALGVGAEETAVEIQRRAEMAMRAARSEAAAFYAPIYDELRGVRVPEDVVQSLDTRLANLVDSGEVAPNSRTARAIETFRNELRNDDGSFVTSVTALDNFVRDYREAVDVGRVDAATAATGTTRRVMADPVSQFEQALFERAPTLRRAREEYARTRQEIVLPVDRALSRIADREAAADARRVFDMVSGGRGRQIETSTLRRGFDALVEADPRVAQDAVGYYIATAWNDAMREVAGSPRPISADMFRRRIFGTSVQQRNMRVMLDSLDRADGIPVGTRWRALENFMDTAAASGTISGVTGSAEFTTALQREMQSGRGILGAVAQTRVIPILGALGRAVSDATAQNNFAIIVDRFTQTDPGSLARIQRMANADPYTTAALVAASGFIPMQQVSAQYQE